MLTIEQVLQQDRECRQPGVEGKLYPLSELRLDQSWMYDLPTLSDHTESSLEMTKDLSKCKKKIIDIDHVLHPNHLDYTNLFIAGGCIRSILTQKRPRDIDIFLYGLESEEEAEERVEKLILDMFTIEERFQGNYYLLNYIPKVEKNLPPNYKDIISKEEKFRTPEEKSAIASLVEKYPEYNWRGEKKSRSKFFRVVNGGHSITIVRPNKIPIQIILRRYDNPSQILHGFDLGSSAVGFDGKNILFTGLGKFCYERMINIFDYTRRSTTYEHRLVKYFNVGFRIVVPNLNVLLLPTRYHRYDCNEIAELPYLSFSYRRIQGNNIIVDDFYNENGQRILFHSNENDYSYSEIICNEELLYLFIWNMKELISDKQRYVHYIDMYQEKESHGTLKGWKLRFHNMSVSWKGVEKHFSSWRNHLVEGKISIRSFPKTFTVLENPAKWLEETYFTRLDKHDVEQRVEKLITTQQDHIKKLFQNISSLDHPSRKLVWYQGDPTSQVSGSFNPVLKSAEEWYGVYFLSISEKCLNKEKEKKPKSSKFVDTNSLFEELKSSPLLLRCEEDNDDKVFLKIKELSVQDLNDNDEEILSSNESIESSDEEDDEEEEEDVENDGDDDVEEDRDEVINIMLTVQGNI